MYSSFQVLSECLQMSLPLVSSLFFLLPSFLRILDHQQEQEHSIPATTRQFNTSNHFTDITPQHTPPPNPRHTRYTRHSPQQHQATFHITHSPRHPLSLEMAASNNMKSTLPNNTPAFGIELVHNAVQKAAGNNGKATAALEASASTETGKENLSQKKPAIRRRRPEASIFHKPTKRVACTIDPTMFKAKTPAELGYDLVRPSKGLKFYRMTETVKGVGLRNKTITKKAKPPKFMISFHEENLSAVRKPEAFAEVMRLAVEEKKKKANEAAIKALS